MQSQAKYRPMKAAPQAGWELTPAEPEEVEMVAEYDTTMKSLGIEASEVLVEFYLWLNVEMYGAIERLTEGRPLSREEALGYVGAFIQDTKN